MKRSLCLSCLAILLCTGLMAQETPYVVLVSFDGFRHDYAERFDLPNFKKFIARGSASRGLIPSFPSKTFPNHYSIVTGLYPGHHGLVNNEFYDPRKGEFYTMDIRDRLVDPYYYSGKPLWTLARENGIKSASYFWVGSEIPDEGSHPDYYFPYEESVPFTERVDQVLEWLKLPVRERPHFVTLYFSSPDHEAHQFGPLSAQARKAAIRVDKMLGRLMEGLDGLSLPVNVILVSDHGLKELEVREDTYIFLDEIMDVDHESFIAVNAGSQVHFYVKDKEQRDSLINVLSVGNRPYTLVTAEEFPEPWNYEHQRSGDLMLVAKPGHYFRDKDRSAYMKSKKPGEKFGVHGYDPDIEPDMVGIFYACGPNIEKGVELPAFRNVHVYPLVARILGMPIPPIDGDFSVLRTIYKK